MKTATVLTYGCAHNQKDSQLIEAQLLKHGFQLVDESEAELVVVNSCTVKEPTEFKIMSKLDSLRHKKEVVVTGCLSQASPEKLKKRYPNYIIMGINAAPYIIGRLRENGNVADKMLSLPVLSGEEKRVEKPLLESTRWNPNLNIVQINEGCLNSCTFCATKLARGRLHSYSLEGIVQSVRRTPTPEVWLTSQDTGCWGFDIGNHVGNLLGELSKIQRKFWIRLGMGNPNNFIKILDEVVDAYHSDKVYKFLHLPVQSGSNRVLRHMRRGYTVEEYVKIVERFREEFPQLTLSTDVIVGYPTETEEEFQATVDVIEKTRPSITNISRYWERSGTFAATLEQIPHEERKRRSGILSKLTRKIQLEDNKQWLGWQGEILAVAKGVKGGVEGRNIFYKPIIIEEVELGKWYDVEIVDVTSTYLLGKLI